MPRTTRIAGSLAIVLIAYWAYALLVAPFLEPPAKEQPVGTMAHGGGGSGDNSARPLEFVVGEKMKEFTGLFPPNDWVWRSDTKMLESDRATLLFQQYKTLSDGRVEITPCTIVFENDGAAVDEAQRRRQSIILETPAGAVLQFDQAINLNQPKMAKLIGGLLRGAATIRSDWKQPGPDDDLGIVTSDVVLSEQSITTPNPVAFRWGPHFGSGQNMLIKLLSKPQKRGAPTSGMNVDGIESFELQRVDRLHLDLGKASEDKLKPSVAPTEPATTETVATAETAKNDSTPVDITCQGPFRFDVVRRVATFRDRVDVVKQNPKGEPDKIVCELLSLFFIERPKTAPEPKTAKAAKTAKKQETTFDMTPERLEAQGDPVVVTSPNEKIVACGQRIEYNLLQKSIALDGGREVFLRRGPNEIHAKALRYQSAGEERLGQVEAPGPGWLRGQSPDRPDQVIEAIWRDRLLVYPHEKEQVISLSGEAELKSPDIGQIQAPKIFFWLTETPPAPSATGKGPNLWPNRMGAYDGVNINSPRLFGKVERMEVRFDKVVAAPLGMTAVPVAFVGGDSRRRSDDEPAGNRRQESPPTGEQDNRRQESPPTTVADAPPQSRYEVAGRLLQAHLLIAGKQQNVSHLLLEDGVRIVESQMSKPGERPLLIHGDRLELTDATAPEATVVIVGRPARFEAPGMGLTGAAIHLDRGANRLWIEGAGQMDMPLSGKLSGGGLLGGALGGSPARGQPAAPAAPAGVLTIDWRRRMEFDGRTARFEESVVAAAPQQQVNTSVMEVQLQRQVNFSDSKMQEKPEIEKISCLGGVAIENRSFDKLQQLSSFDRMEAADLAINVLAGQMQAGGPGKINSVRYASANDALLGDRVAGMPGGAPAAAPGAGGKGLKCLHINFPTSMTGAFSLTGRVLTFNGRQVQTTYGPVDKWDAVLDTGNPDQLGEGGVVMRCNQLTVAEMQLPLGDRKAVELAALGNATVEGTTFKALGNRITYAESKDLLIIEGDGRNLAEIFSQKQIGGPVDRSSAEKIQYWIKTKDVKSNGSQSVEIQLPAGKK